MRSPWLLIFPILAWSGVAAAETAVHVGIGTNNLQFDFLYTDYAADAQVVQREVAYIGEPDLLVALHLARACRMDVDVIVGWRRAGMSWDRITRRCHEDASIFYVEIPEGVSGPPYGRAHGHWKRHPKGDLALTDAEVREFVLARALAGHCGVPVTEIVRRRAAGEPVKTIVASTKRSEDAAPRPPDRRPSAANDSKGSNSKKDRGPTGGGKKHGGSRR
jgi:hypothetical protein